jgi:hypothetical protein
MEAVTVFRIITRNRRHEDGRRQCQRGIGGEFLRRHHLAAGNPGLIGGDAFDVFDITPGKPFGRLLPVLHTAKRFDIGRRTATRGARNLLFRRISRHQSPENDFDSGMIAVTGLNDKWVRQAFVCAIAESAHKRNLMHQRPKWPLSAGTFATSWLTSLGS